MESNDTKVDLLQNVLSIGFCVQTTHPYAIYSLAIFFYAIHMCDTYKMTDKNYKLFTVLLRVS